MYKLTKTSVRPNASVKFFYETVTESAEVNTVIDSFQTSGKIVSVERSLSDDGLTLTSIYMFESTDAFTSFMGDAGVFEHIIIPTQIYDVDNDIVSSSEVVEV